jgi:hypothetical protein
MSAGINGNNLIDNHYQLNYTPGAFFVNKVTGGTETFSNNG